MKYKITDKQLESIIFLYLDNQDFIQIKIGDNIYFVNSEGDEYAQIRYDKDDGWCGIYDELIYEISRFFSLDNFDSEEIIGKWVENTLNMSVTGTSLMIILFVPIVENTL
jgi:hypothetical protein